MPQTSSQKHSFSMDEKDIFQMLISNPSDAELLRETYVGGDFISAKRFELLEELSQHKKLKQLLYAKSANDNKVINELVNEDRKLKDIWLLLTV